MRMLVGVSKGRANMHEGLYFAAALRYGLWAYSGLTACGKSKLARKLDEDSLRHYPDAIFDTRSKSPFND